MDKVVAAAIKRLSFSRKLAFTFFLCSFLTFAVIDITMHVLYSTVVTSTKSDSTFNTQAFSQFSNNQILSSAQAYLQSGLDLYQQIMTQTYTTYFYFQQNPDIYQSYEVRGKNPKECQAYSNYKYDRSCVYFYTENSTFYDHPFFDKVIASSATQHYPNSLKRISIIYQSKTNPDDIMVRTVPATRDFYIPNSEIVTQKIQSTLYGKVSFTDWYYDSLSKQNNSSKLISLRILIAGIQDYDILIQIQVMKYILDYALTNIYSFPSTKVVLVKLLENSYSIIGQNTVLPSSVNISEYLQTGERNITISNAPYLVTTSALVDDNNDINQVGQVMLTSRENGSQITDMRMIIFLNKTQTQRPNNIYRTFSQNSYNTLVFLLYGWTFLILLIVVAIGVVVGDIIFSYFSLIRRKCKQYLYHPIKINQIDLEIKENYEQTKNRQLFENVISIMQGIQNKKAENKKNYKISYDTFPRNRMGMEFQKKMRIKDYNKFQAIAKIIKEKQQNCS